jgi:hypothetical protein
MAPMTQMVKLRSAASPRTVYRLLVYLLAAYLLTCSLPTGVAGEPPGVPTTSPEIISSQSPSILSLSIIYKRCGFQIHVHCLGDSNSMCNTMHFRILKVISI